MICLPRRRSASVAKGIAVSVGAAMVVALGAPVAGPARAAESTPSPQSTTSSSPDSTPGTGAEPETETEEDPGAAEATPLRVTLTSMSPGVVPSQGPVVLEGSVTNASEEVWQDVNAAAFLGDAAMSSRAEVAEASRTDEEAFVGSRLDLPQSFVPLGDLAPGQSASYSVRVPQSALPPQEATGVYWIGVHALGTNGDGRDGVADGRARSFIPVVGEDAADADPAQVSLVVPLRQAAVRAEDGSLAQVQRWVGRTSARLGRLADFAASSGSRPLTWLVDPAVLDALDDLGQGNPALSLGSAERTLPDPDADPDAAPTDPTASATPAPSASPEEPGAPDDQAAPEIPDGAVPDATQAASARALLDRLVDLAGSGPLLGLPLADADAVGLARERPDLLVRAAQASQRSLADRGLTGTTALAPPDGLVDLEPVAEVLPRLPEQTQVLMSDDGRLDLTVASRLELPAVDGSVATGLGSPLVLTDARASAGGPAPITATDPLALRQRILAEASLEVLGAEALDGSPRPVVVMLPSDFDPGRGWAESEFFPELDTPWLDLADLPTPMSRVDPDQQAEADDPEETDELALPAYPAEAEAAELPLGNALAAERLLESAEAADGLLANDNDVLTRLGGAALQATSYAARSRPRAAEQRATALTEATEGLLDGVTVFGTEFVTLSSGSGTLTVTLVNDLEQPVLLGVEVRAVDDVRAESPEPIELGPEQRATLRLPVVSEEGVHDVRLQPVTSTGEAVGEPFDFVLRTSQVGRLVWVLMAAGGAVFLVTLLRRVRQRLRERRRGESTTSSEVRIS